MLNGNLINLKGNTVFKEMCILENEYTLSTFYINDHVQVIMINCTIDKLTTTEPIMTEDILPPKSFINALKLLNTRLCEGTYDIVGTLKPIIKESICHKTVHSPKETKLRSNYFSHHIA